MKPTLTTNYQLPSTGNLRVAIVHDWLIGGGAEKVVEQLHEMYPDAPIYTSYCTDEWRKRLDNKVVTGPLQHLGKIRKYIPVLRIWWFARLKFDGYDLVISSSGAEAKGIKVRRSKLEDGRSPTTNYQLPTTKPLHVAYIHAPTHYYWSRYESYMQSPGFGAFDWLARIGLKLLVGPLRRWDYKAAQRPDYLIANSTHTQEQIKKYYHRDSVVIHPPIDTTRFQPSTINHQPSTKLPSSFVITGRHVPYKRVDIAVQACSELGLDLIVIGDGPEHQKLKAMAGPTIKFLGYAADEELENAIRTAKAFLFPGIDDFGIVAVEAMAAGTPVVAYKAGGALDYVVPGKTGEFFDEQTAASLAAVLKTFDSTKYDPRDIQSHAEKFSNQAFHQHMNNFIEKILR